MPGTTRKLLTVICEAGLESRLAEDVMQLGAHGYTVTDARGRGSRGVRNAAWESVANIRLEASTDGSGSSRCPSIHRAATTTRSASGW